jgi:CBS domain-containing protein
VASVASVMSRNLAVIDPSSSLVEAARAMVDRRVGSVLVLDGDRLAGILTERDILRVAASGSLEGRSVKQCMTRDPESIAPDAELDHAAVLMLHGGFRHLPVVEGERVVGMLSMRDLMSHAWTDVAPRGV